MSSIRNLQLPNLFDLKKELDSIISKYKGTERVLSEEFKEHVRNAIPNENSIIFFEKTAIYTIKFKNGSKKVYLPNQWFELALYNVKYYIRLIQYKEAVVAVIPDNLKSKKETEKLFLDASSKKVPYNQKDLVVLINASTYTDEEKELLIQFVTNYPSWGGGKQISRTDFYNSSILDSINVLNTSSEYISTFAKIFAEDDYLSNLIVSINLDDEDRIEEILENNSLDGYSGEKNIIYYGAPGTGKSFELNKVIKEDYPTYDVVGSNSSKYVYRTTIYPEYSYYDFVGHLMPETKDGTVSYQFKPGVFTEALAASLQTQKNVYLIIEEMSRGNIASIFGDIFQLLDRNESGSSEYGISNSSIAKAIDIITVMNNSDMDELEKSNKLKAIENSVDYANKKIKLPSNLIIMGTVNTSDQNVFVLDTAFKRRFSFKYMSVSPSFDEENDEYYNNFKFKLDNDNDVVEWIDFYQAINKVIQEKLLLPEDKLIGQFFIKGIENDLTESIIWNTEQIKNKLLQYLWEDVEKLSVIKGVQAGTGLFAAEGADRQFSRIYENFGNGEVIFSETLYHNLSEQLLSKNNYH